MYRFYLAAIDMLPGAILLLPVFCILNKLYFHNIKKSVLCYLFSCYLSVVYVLVGLPNVTYIRPELNLNLIPLVGLIGDWKNSILNVLLFIPLGFMLPILWHKYRTPKCTVICGFILSLAVELLQILTYRATDVNDLITNTLGAYLGFLCTRPLFRKLRAVSSENSHEQIVVTASVVIVMFFVYPFVSAALWDYILT